MTPDQIPAADKAMIDHYLAVAAKRAAMGDIWSMKKFQDEADLIFKLATWRARRVSA